MARPGAVEQAEFRRDCYADVVVARGGFEIVRERLPSGLREAVVSAMASIGAFKLVAGGEASAGAGAEMGNAGVHASGKETKSILRAAGDPASCERSTKDEPNQDCRSPIQIFLTPIRRSVPLRVLSPLPDEKG
jgi:hypothetical protein